MVRGEDAKARLLSEASYRAGSWTRARRVVYKVEILEKGVNTRFVATNRAESSIELHDGHYVLRGEAENRIKDYENAPRANRLSCRAFLANQFRLFSRAAAHWLLDTLRGRLSSKGFGRMQSSTRCGRGRSRSPGGSNRWPGGCAFISPPPTPASGYGGLST